MKKKMLIVGIAAVLTMSAFACVYAVSENPTKGFSDNEPSVQTQNREELTPEEKENAAANYDRFAEEGKAHIYEQGIEEQIEYIGSLES